MLAFVNEIRVRNLFNRRNNVKAIPDCKWMIEIVSGKMMHGANDSFWWWAESKQAGTGPLTSDEFLKTPELAKHSWEAFAKLNKIKRYKYL